MCRIGRALANAWTLPDGAVVGVRELPPIMPLLAVDLYRFLITVDAS